MLGMLGSVEGDGRRKNEPVFFRPTPYGSRQVVYQAGKPVAFCKFTELMQWQHHHDDNVHQKEN